ncbi:hypothetical protein D7X33_22230 [Butyricicoccus sp. 1XD8-22]|nr:hypothetical protein D7X33_22230 [Butyricicoccus sp. 1XD8-22]
MLNIQLVESLKGKDFSSLSKEEKKQIQRYNFVKDIVDQLERRTKEECPQLFPEHLYNDLLLFIDESNYTITFDGTFYGISKK